MMRKEDGPLERFLAMAPNVAAIVGLEVMMACPLTHHAKPILSWLA